VSSGRKSGGVLDKFDIGLIPKPKGMRSGTSATKSRPAQPQGQKVPGGIVRVGNEDDGAFRGVIALSIAFQIMPVVFSQELLSGFAFKKVSQPLDKRRSNIATPTTSGIPEGSAQGLPFWLPGRRQQGMAGKTQ